MIDVDKELKTNVHTEIFFLNIIRQVEKERDRAVELCTRLETEWRNKDNWIGEKRPEEIKKWVIAQLEKKQ